MALECGTRTGPNGCGSKNDPRKCSERPAMRVALQHGQNIAKRLGPGWKGRAWCNLGEHYEAVHESSLARVMPNDDGTYSASVEASAGPFTNHWAKDLTPEAAVRRALREVRAYAEGELSKVARIEKTLGA